MFPTEVPTAQLSLLAQLVLRGQLKEKRREAAEAAWWSTGYLLGTLLKNDPAVTSAGTLSTLAMLSDSEAAEMLTMLASSQQAVFDRTKLLQLAQFLLQILPMLLG